MMLRLSLLNRIICLLFLYVLSANQHASAFSYLLAGDTQFYWSIQDSGGDGQKEQREGMFSNTNQIKAMNSLANADSPLEMPNLVLLLGDLTAYAHDYQWDIFLKMYIAGTKTNLDTQLKIPVFWGLGNHDYANNTPLSPGQGCMTANNAFLGYYGCARRSLRRLHQFVQAHVLPTQSPYGLVPDVSNSDTHDAYNLVFGKGSWAYSWNQEGYHFVQLNNYPMYTNDGIDVKPSLSWLKADLDSHPYFKVVLLMHDGVSWDYNNAEFIDAIKGHNVVAMFTGHVHSGLGLYTYHTSSGRPIPIFFSGSSPWNTFMHVRFERKQFTVTEMSSVTGTPQILANSVYRV